MSRPTTTKEIEGAAHHAGMKEWSASFDRAVAGRTLQAEPEAELVDTEAGAPALIRGGEYEIREASGQEDLLGRFVRLTEKDAEAYVRYAREFGLLDLCEHALFHMHPSDGACARLDREPVPWWRLWSKRARATLAVATNLHQGKPGRESDWSLLAADEWPGRELGLWFLAEGSVELGSDLATDREALGVKLDDWLRVAGARVAVGWDPEEARPFLDLGGTGLFQNVARELVLTVSKLDGLAVCDGCGNPYSPERKPRADRHNYCEPCREAGVPGRHRQRRRRRAQESKG